MSQLSEQMVRGAQPRKSVRTISDGGTGLHLKIEPSGTKTYIWRWRVGTKHRKITIGVAHAMKVEAARAVAQVYTNAVKLGRDPYLEAKAEKSKVRLTTDEAWERYDSKIVEHQKSRKDKRRYYKTDVKPVLGSTLIGAVNTDDLRLVVSTATDRSEGGGRLVYRLLSAFLKWCVEEDIIQTSPLFQKRWKAPAPRERYLSEEEICWFLAACEQVRGQGLGQARQWAGLLEVLLRTGCRESEIALLRVSEVDFEKGTMTLEKDRHKSGRKFVQPLTREVLDILNREKKGDRFFRAGAKSKNCALIERTMAEIAGRPVVHWYPHALRKTVDTQLRDAWDDVADREVADHFTIEAILGHTLAGVSKHYNHSTLERKKRRVLLWWNSWLNARAQDRPSC